MLEMLGWIVAAVLLIALAVVGWLYVTSTRRLTQQLQVAQAEQSAATRDADERLARAREEAERILEDARTRQKELILEGKDEQLRLRAALETEHREQRAEIQRLETRIRQKEEQLDHKTEQLDARDRKLQAREKEADALRAQLDRAADEQRKELERVAGLTGEEAKRLLLLE